ncbi:hypothetical protein BHE74_00023629 [Ensete ventricosum]|nr:hypothetical protein GW17_00012021 [Ensete ventricosum]RWW68821.1 hypothetical protein BHE74_00023629 [Ensete ventricosum]RZR89032.1 hypothetical protein BHM03_00016700 [Ensete ventricosum]
MWSEKERCILLLPCAPHHEAEAEAEAAAAAVAGLLLILMHRKKLDREIGKESFAPSSSSGLEPLRPPPLLPLFPSFAPPTLQIPDTNSNPNLDSPYGLSAPHKRSIMTPSAAGSSASAAVAFPCVAPRRLVSSAARRILRHLDLRLRIFLLLSFSSLYLLLSSSGADGGDGAPGRSFLVDFFSAIAFSCILLVLCVSLNALPFRSFRLLLSRSAALLLPRHHLEGRQPPASPILWSIGSSSSDKPKTDHRPASGFNAQLYSNGDVYEGEFHQGKCSGSGVYCYYMSGRYEGDWIDGKYDGYGVETWARGSRYRGHYRQGLRHGFGMYRFYTGDMYAGEWSNGQSHGCGLHTCEDGSRYAGEFKSGVKHGLGHYHFRYILKSFQYRSWLFTRCAEFFVSSMCRPGYYFLGLYDFEIFKIYVCVHVRVRV